MGTLSPLLDKIGTKCLSQNQYTCIGCQGVKTIVLITAWMRESTIVLLLHLVVKISTTDIYYKILGSLI